jgi:hypothetical protein
MTNWQNYISIKKSKQARRYSLRLNHKLRRIDLIVPHRSSETRALAFAAQYQDWIEDKIAALPCAIPFAQGETIPIFDIPHRIEITFDDKRKSTKVSLKDGIIHVLTNQTDPSLRIERHLKKYAKEVLTTMVHEKAMLLGKRVNQVNIRDTSSRWGSCCCEGNIALSWRLIFAPIETTDYVIAHEVAHLKHLDHSPKFWKLCESLSDDYTIGKKWIKNEGHTLMRYGTAF